MVLATDSIDIQTTMDNGLECEILACIYQGTDDAVVIYLSLKSKITQLGMIMAI